MGFPLSTFQQLAGLCRNEPGIRQSFDEFKLISIIVHDVDDDDFREHIRSNFEYLHEITDKGFAFICFIKPPVTWALSHVRWIHLRHSLTIGDGLDDAGFMAALRRRLRIPSGPCIILTDNLLSNRYIILPTTKDDVVKQMEEIGAYANAQPGPIPLDSKEFLSFIYSIGPAAFTARTEDEEPVAKNIADLTAIRALTGAGAVKNRLAVEIQKGKAGPYVKAMLRSLWNKLESLRNSRKPEDTDKADDVLQTLSESLALIAESRPSIDNSPYDRYMIKGVEMDILEPLTKSSMSNYNMLLPFYLSDDISDLYPGIDMPVGFKKDFSGLGIFLGKAIEEEMNASMIQKARQLMGVHMPSHWRRYEAELKDRCEVPTRDKTIYLNWKGKQLSAHDYSDQSFPIGVVVSILKEVSRNSAKGIAMGEFCTREFLDRADEFARLRNASSHTGFFDRAAFEKMHDAFGRILAVDMPEMMQLKKALLGVG